MEKGNFFEKAFGWEKKYSWLMTLLTFAVVYLILTYRMNLRWVFLDTRLCGGDSASWHQVMLFLRDELIPNGRLFGYDLSNLFGYNNFQFYFIPPFLIAALLSYIMPATIALKIATLLGSFLLPLAAFYTGKAMTGKARGGRLAAVLSLVFLYNPSYSMFGGNLYSTLAGEFSYSFAFAAFVFYIGVVFKTFKEGKSPFAAGLLLGLIGLSHTFVFMVASFVPAFFLFSKLLSRLRFQSDEDSKIDESAFLADYPAWKIGLIYLYGFLLMAFWFVPMMMNMQYSQPIAMTWNFASFKEFFIMTALWAPLSGMVLSVSVFFSSRKFRLQSGLFLYLFLVCVFLYFASHFLDIPDIRFVPPIVMVSLLSVPVFLESYKDTPAAFWIKKGFFLLAIFATFLMAKLNPFVETWFDSNYKGYELTSGYSNVNDLYESLGGDLEDGRIAWEKVTSDVGGNIGGTRAFESLYMFTGRPGMEGIHYGSSHMARQTLYLDSMYSSYAFGPDGDRIFAEKNQEWVSNYFALMNISGFIAYSDTYTGKFEADESFSNTGEFGIFTTFEFLGADRSYVDVLKLSNLSVVKTVEKDFKSEFLRYFRYFELFEHPFVPADFADEELLSLLPSYTNYGEYYDAMDALGLFDESTNEVFSNESVASDLISEENVDHMEFSFHTKAVGKPHLIKMAYYPNWQSENGEEIYPIAPGFMMLIPTTSEVKLIFTRSKMEVFGFLLTLMLIPLLIFRKKIESLKFFDNRTFARIVAGVFSALVILTLILSFGGRDHVRAYQRAQAAFNAQDHQTAFEITSRYTTDELLTKDNDSYSFNLLVLRMQSANFSGNRAAALEALYELKARYEHTELYQINGISQYFRIYGVEQ